ncbi:MAG: BMP family ABC transporter substrate-binding protein [Ruminococcaceae bacterium]|nr:BMP family ABC transporter substrate-binding protein [Oscillospiraceae bacterium]
MKRFLAVFITFMLIFTFVSCSDDKKDDREEKKLSYSQSKTEKKEKTKRQPEEVKKDKVFKVGFIFVNDENSTYDKNFMDAALEVQKILGLSDSQVVFKTNIPESIECYEAAADLADQGCDIVFANSYGHEPYILKAAKEFRDVEFCHSSGTMAHTAKLPNFHNAYASIYEGRYLTGVAAGMKLNEMIESGKITADQAKIGYVGAYSYAEVISDYTAFFLGARSICPTATMDVTHTGSWYDEAKEKEAAIELIESGCVLISQYADSMGVPTACENAGVPNVSYNGSTASACPNTFIVSSEIDWTPYYEFAIKAAQAGKKIPYDWCGGIKDGSVKLSNVNKNVAAAGTEKKLKQVKSGLMDGSIPVFDTSTFTVDGRTLDSYMADIDIDSNYVPDTEVIANGYFHECEYRSAPYFDVRIDGINIINESY